MTDHCESDALMSGVSNVSIKINNKWPHMQSNGRELFCFCFSEGSAENQTGTEVDARSSASVFNIFKQVNFLTLWQININES